MTHLMRQKYCENTGRLDSVRITDDILPLSKPTVIFLSGGLTNGKNPQTAAGGLYHISEMLDSFDTQNSTSADICAMSYKGLGHNIKSAFNYNCRPHTYYSKEAALFFNRFLLPHIADTYTTDKKGRILSGQAKSAEDIKRAFQKLTLIGYSYGTVFGQELFNAGKARLTELGFLPTDARQLLGEIHYIGMGAISRPMKEKNRFTSICLVASNDRITRHKRKIWWSLREVFASYARKLTIRPLSRSSLYIAAPVKKDLWEPKTDKDGNIVMRNIKPLYPKWWINHSYHELPHYTTDKDHNNQFAKIARFALINSIKRQRRLTPQEMIAVPECLRVNTSTFLQEYDSYQKRITGAQKKLRVT